MGNNILLSLSAEQIFHEAMNLMKIDFDSGISRANEAIQLALAENDFKSTIDFFYTLGRTSRLQGNGLVALEKLNEAHRILNKYRSKDTLRLAKIYKEKGALFIDYFKDSTTALDYSFRALQLNVPEIETPLHINIACQYIHLNAFEKAEFHLDIAEKQCEEMEDKTLICFVYENGGNMFQKQGKLHDAIRLYKKGISYSVLENFEEDKRDSIAYIRSFIITELCECLMELEDYNPVLGLLNECKVLATEFNLSSAYALAYCLEGVLNIKLNKFQEFKQLFEKGMEFCQKNQLQEQKAIWLTNMVEVCEKEGNYKCALRYNKELQSGRKEHTEKVKVLNLTSILENKEREIASLEKRNNAIEIQKEQTEQLAYIMAHDLKTPLSNISNFIGLFTNNYGHKVDEENLEYLNFVLQNSKVMHGMLDELLHYISIEVDPKTIIACDIVKFMDNASSWISEDSKDVTVTIETENSCTVDINPVHLKLILNRLISNSIKFAHNDRPLFVKVNAYSNPESSTIEIIDNGIGIEVGCHLKVFDLFKRLDKVNYAGLGMGLSTCKKLVNAYHGTIIAENNEYGGTTIKITIPNKH